MRQCGECKRPVDISEYYEICRQPLGSRWSFCSLSCLLRWTTKKEYVKGGGNGPADVQG